MMAVAFIFEFYNYTHTPKEVVSIYGDPMQRLAAYMVEGLSAKIQSTGPSLCRILNCKKPPKNEVLSAMQIIYEVCAYFAANGAIAEPFKDEERVYIIDFEIALGTQWISLIQALAARQGGAPHIKITGVGDPKIDAAASGGLETVGQRLTKLVESVGVILEFYPLQMNGAEVQLHMLKMQPGEALAVNFAMQLHHMPDESVCVENPRERILRMVKSLHPKVVTLVEQEANTNTANFLSRFKETFSYYSAIFDSIDITLPRESRDRVNVEQHCLARDMVNVIACEGTDRVERHELFGKWKARMSMAGFATYPLSSIVNQTIKCLLQSYSSDYTLEDDGDVLYLGWKDKPLVVASAWH